MVTEYHLFHTLIKGTNHFFFVIKVLQAYKVDFSFLEGRIYFSTVMDVCTFFLLNLLFRSVGFWLKKSCIYSLNFFTLFLLIFKKIFSFFKSHSLFKLFWNCDWHVFRTCRFFFLKKIEGLFFCTLAHETAIENVCCFRAKKEKLSQAIKKTLEAQALHKTESTFWIRIGIFADMEFHDIFILFFQTFNSMGHRNFIKHVMNWNSRKDSNSTSKNILNKKCLTKAAVWHLCITCCSLSFS